MSTTEELLERKSRGSDLENRDYGHKGQRDTQAMELLLLLLLLLDTIASTL
jgi:hypothetical protein